MTSIPNQTKPHAPAEVPLLGDVAVAEVIDVDSLLTQETEQWLSYPFLGGDKVELAAKRLALCDPMTLFKTEDLITVQLEKSVGRNQIITFSKLDRLSLNPKTYVNDNVVDFWMVWITRNERDNASSILTCTSHFYDCLVNPNFGLEHVSRWMQNRKVDIFSKDFILFPICLDKHWSLIVTYFAGLLPNNDRNVKPVIVHLDPLNFMMQI
jgi:Ulp1 family protease